MDDLCIGNYFHMTHRSFSLAQEKDELHGKLLLRISGTIAYFKIDAKAFGKILVYWQNI